MDFLSLAAFNISSGIRDLEALIKMPKAVLLGRQKKSVSVATTVVEVVCRGSDKPVFTTKNGTEEITPFCKPWRKKIKEAATVVVFLSQAAGLQLDFHQECS